jgi:hypothetical protein
MTRERGDSRISSDFSSDVGAHHVSGTVGNLMPCDEFVGTKYRPQGPSVDAKVAREILGAGVAVAVGVQALHRSESKGRTSTRAMSL